MLAQAKLKVHLKLAISRLRIVQQKDTAVAKQQRRAMAVLLEVLSNPIFSPREPPPLDRAETDTATITQQGKTASARIRIENIIRSDLLTELHEQLELYCELLLARAGLLEPAALDPGLDEAVRSILYAAPRTDVKELHQARALLADKYGKDFALAGQEDRDGRVPDGVRRRLRAEPPGADLVERYLEAIAAAYGVPYGDAAPGGADVRSASADGGEGGTPRAGGGGGGDGAAAESETTGVVTAQESPHPPRALGPRSPVSIAPPSPSTDNARPSIRLPGPPELRPSERMRRGIGAGPGGDAAAVQRRPEGAVPDVDDLESRFKMLKR